MKDFRNEGLMKLLIDRSKQELDDKLLKMAEDQENSLQKIKLQLVAANKKDLAQMEKRLEEDLAKEKRNEEIKFEKRKRKMLKDLKQKYLDGLKERDNLGLDKEAFLKKHEEEISKFELALAKEKERQFRRMREKLILKRLEAEKERERKRRETRINRQLREDEEDIDTTKRRGRKRGGKHANLLRQITDVMSDRMETDYAESSIIPRKHKQNLNVMLRQFKENVGNRLLQHSDQSYSLRGKKELLCYNNRQEKEGKFDPTIYARYCGDEDDDFGLRRLGTDEVSLRSGGTASQYGEEGESTRLLRRIIRVEKLSNRLSEKNVQQLIQDLTKLVALLKKGGY
jgi:hypothetical protein